MGNLNPFRYRGYYQDTETGFYYLMSRYYDTVTHRFVNADGYFQTGLNPLEANMNIYCGNNPVMYTDPNGKIFFIALIIAAVIGSAAGMGATMGYSIASHKKDTQSSSFRKNVDESKKNYKSKVNIYEPGKGKKDKNKINISVNKNHESNGTVNPNIHIEDSYKITNEEDMVAIIELIMESPVYDEEVFIRSKGSYVAEWRAHNTLYSLTENGPDFLKEKFKDADLDNKDVGLMIWDLYN